MTQKSLASMVAFVPEDNPDWDHARNRQLALRVPEAEWSQSALTELQPDGFYTVRNDFSYEGLLCLVHQETWKFMDHLGFQLVEGDEAIALTATRVEASPEKVIYHYASDAGDLMVTYALLDRGRGASSVLSVEFKLSGARKGLTLKLKPVLDMRHMYQPSDPGRHRVKRAEPHHVTFVNSQRWFGIGSATAFTFAPDRGSEELSYRLGNGEREGGNGQVTFKREYFVGFVAGVLSFDFEQAVQVSCIAGDTEAAVIAAMRDAEASGAKWLAAQESRFDAYRERFARLPVEAIDRIYVMAEKFGVPVGDTLIPESGGWWFRTPWFRNVFEGFLHNHRTLSLLGKGRMIEDSLRTALLYQEPASGRLPSRIPELKADLDRWEQTGCLPAEYYVASDAVLVMFTLLDEYLPQVEDESLLEAAWAGFQRMFSAFKASRLNLRQGNPVLLENGLLAAVPAHSWMNGKRVVFAEGITVTDLPIRVPLNWQIQDILHFRDSHYTWEQYQYPTYYLPEVNAEWIRALSVGKKLAARFEDEALAEELDQIGQMAKAAFKSIFWNPHTKGLYNLVSLDRRIDGTPCATGVEAAALLGQEVFTRQELEQIWQLTRNRLLVKRKVGETSLPFGLIAKDSPERIFYDNQQYHEAVVWPRETPYLVRLLRELGQEKTIQELLEASLAHQMDEGTVFYNNEMLSLPEGVNPSPNAETATNPVPVKNQMQWWSQWCDPYLEGR